jgi:regulator of protease activity HflC (stomatin/prohibitin superfamily)
MDQFLAWLSRIFDSWKFWIVIAPWEIGVRIRLGKNAASLRPGFHLRVPFIDVITMVNTRLRIDNTPPITVQGGVANHTRTVTATVGYRVIDPLKAMMKFGLPSAVVISKAQGEIASACDEQAVLESLRSYFGDESGVSIDFVKFVENVEVRTYRLINGGSWGIGGHESLSNGAASGRY